jgi:hypothetical protein
MTYIVRRAHAPGEEALFRGRPSHGFGPVVRRAGIDLALRADERALLHPSDVTGIRTCEEGIRPQLLVELDERSRLDQLGGKPIPLALGSVAPLHSIGLSEFGDLLDPFEELLVVRGGVAETGNVHRDSVVAWCGLNTPGEARLDRRMALPCRLHPPRQACKRCPVSNGTAGL